MAWIINDQCSCLTRAFNIPGIGGEAGGLPTALDIGGYGGCGWYMPDMLEPSPPSEGNTGTISSFPGLSQNFIALRT